MIINNLYRVFRIVINSFALILMLFVAFAVWNYSPLYSVIFFLGALDQFEDVYYYTTRKRLVPLWLFPFDVMFEVSLAGVGIAMLVFSLIYYSYFQTWFFKLMIPLSFAITYSAIEDIVVWFRAMHRARESILAPSTVSHYVCPKEEIREETRFIRRKQ